MSADKEKKRVRIVDILEHKEDIEEKDLSLIYEEANQFFEKVFKAKEDSLDKVKSILETNQPVDNFIGGIEFKSVVGDLKQALEKLYDKLKLEGYDISDEDFEKVKLGSKTVKQIELIFDKKDDESFKNLKTSLDFAQALLRDDKRTFNKFIKQKNVDFIKFKKLNEEKKKFEDLVVSLVDKISVKYPQISSRVEFENLIILKTDVSKFKSLVGESWCVFREDSGNAINSFLRTEDYLYIRDVFLLIEKNENDKLDGFEKFLKYINSELKSLQKLRNLSFFYKLQKDSEFDNIIKKEVDKEESEKIRSKYWSNYGASLEQAIIVLKTNFEPFSNFFAQLGYYGFDSKLNKSNYMIFELFPYLFDNSTQELDEALAVLKLDSSNLEQDKFEFVNKFYDFFFSFKDSVRTDIDKRITDVNIKLKDLKGSLKLLENFERIGAKKKEKEIKRLENQLDKLFERIKGEKNEQINDLIDEIQDLKSQVREIDINIREESRISRRDFMDYEEASGGAGYGGSFRRPVFNNEAFSAERDSIKDQIKSLKDERNSIIGSIKDKERNIKSLRGDSKRDNPEVNDLEEKIENLKEEVVNLKLNKKIKIYDLNDSSFLRFNEEEVEVTLSEVDEYIVIVSSLITKIEELRKEYFEIREVFVQFSDFLTQIMDICHLLKNNKKVIISDYIEKLTDDPAEYGVVWRDLNKNFKSLGGHVFNRSNL